MNRRIEPELATIVALSVENLTLATSNLEFEVDDVVFLNFTVLEESYFFQAQVLACLGDSKTQITIPDVIYRRERRSRERTKPRDDNPKLLLEFNGQAVSDLVLVDASPEGIAVDVRSELADRLRSGAQMFVVHGLTRAEEYGAVRHAHPSSRRGWTRLGLQLSPAPPANLRCETLQSILPATATERLGRSFRIATGGAQLAFQRALRLVGRESRRMDPRIVDIYDSSGRLIRALVDSWGDLAGGIAVVVPPAWGRTKETLLPLAATMVECFRRNAQPISVFRFDGINKRGESFRPADCQPFGREHYRFTFSQGVEDIVAVVDHLQGNPGGPPARIVLVSFSASSIEARRVVATDLRIDGWVCVVGSADLQSMLKSISGGIDYALGAERGVRFGVQEILGVAVDMDLAGADALRHDLAYMSDAKQDMARIRVPITWISGRYDAWMDAGRVRDALSQGDTSRRKLIEVPTGHMLKSSREALGVFQLVAREISEICTGGPVPAATPSLAMLDRKRRGEVERLAPRAVNLRRFWEDYLLGRERKIGFELMTLTSAYRELMLGQIDELRLRDEGCVIDLGSGTGAFPFYLRRCRAELSGVRVIEVDFVREALRRARSRLGNAESLGFIEANLEGGPMSGVPVASGCADAVLASLVLSYVSDSRFILREIHRMLRPGGRVVVSSLRRDADMSKLFVDGAQELRERWRSELSDWGAGVELETATRAYLNEASRLLDLEEQGRFAFWDSAELAEMLCEESFEEVEVRGAFGDPPQAIVASASRGDRAS